MNYIKNIILFLLVLSTSLNAGTFTMQTEIGQITVPNLLGYTKANSSVVNGIQKNMRAFGTNKEVYFVLIPENEVMQLSNFTDVISLFQGPISTYISEAEFESICTKTKEEIYKMNTSFPSSKVGSFTKDKNFFFTVRDIPISHLSPLKYMQVIFGGLRIRGHLFSFQAISMEQSEKKKENFINFMKEICELNTEKTKDIPFKENSSKLQNNLSNNTTQIPKINQEKIISLLKSEQKRFRTLGIEKAGGIDIEISYPQIMTSKPGRQPHILQIFTINLDPYSFMVSIGVMPIPTDTSSILTDSAHTKNKEEINEYAKLYANNNLVDTGTQLLDYGSTTISDINIYWSLIRNTTERLGFKCQQLAKMFTIPAFPDKILSINFLLSQISSNESYLPPIPISEFENLNPLVFSILNSLTFMNKEQLSNKDTKLEGEKIGTGWFISPTHIVTCWHVLSQGTEFFFNDFDGIKIPCTLIAKDEFNDLAVLKISHPSYSSQKWLKFSQKSPYVSDEVYTAGFPHPTLLGQDAKFTEGIVSALTNPNVSNNSLIQITVPLQQGNSGGPLVDKYGNVIGVVAMKSTQLDDLTQDKLQNVNFAINATLLKQLLAKNGIPITYNNASIPLTKRDIFTNIRDSIILMQVK